MHDTVTTILTFLGILVGTGTLALSAIVAFGTSGEPNAAGVIRKSRNLWSQAHDTISRFEIPDPFPWRLVGWSLILWCYHIVSKCLLAPVYIVVLADGWRLLFAPFGFRFIGNIRISHVLSAFLLAGAWWMWNVNIRVWLEACDTGCHRDWNEDKYKAFVKTLGLGLLGFDFLLFYLAASQYSWGDSGFSFSAFVAAALWVCVLVFVVFVGVAIKHKVLDAKESRFSL